MANLSLERQKFHSFGANKKKFIHVSRYVLSEFDMSAFSLVQSGKDLKV